MLDKNLIQSTSSWPFVEIRKLLKDRKDIIKKKGKALRKLICIVMSLSTTNYEKKSFNYASILEDF